LATRLPLSIVLRSLFRRRRREEPRDRREPATTADELFRRLATVDYDHDPVYDDPQDGRATPGATVADPDKV
jgi:hypothetical protein